MNAVVSACKRTLYHPSPDRLVGHYNGTFTNTPLDGTYNVTIYANKTGYVNTGYVNDTAELSFFFVIP